MEKTWLIQKGQWLEEKDNTEKGLLKYLKLLFMGAEDFDVRVDPKDGKTKNAYIVAMKTIAIDRKDYDFFEMKNLKDYKDRTLKIFCKKSDYEEVVANIKKMTKDKLELKRPCGLSDYLERVHKKEDEFAFNRATFWWDIVNGYMFFFAEDKEDIIRNAIEEETEWLMLNTETNKLFIDKVFKSC